MELKPTFLFWLFFWHLSGIVPAFSGNFLAFSGNVWHVGPLPGGEPVLLGPPKAWASIFSCWSTAIKDWPAPLLSARRPFRANVARRELQLFGPRAADSTAECSPSAELLFRAMYS